MTLHVIVPIEICCNKLDSDNIIHVYIQVKTTKAERKRNIIFTQSLMLHNIFFLSLEITPSVTVSDFSYVWNNTFETPDFADPRFPF